MKRLLVLALFTCAPAWGQTPQPPAPIVPVAAIVVPKVQPLIVFADGSTSKTSLSWQVVEPADVPVRVEGAALIIPDPVPGTTYRLALVATGDSPPFAFRFASITAPALAPVVVPPTPQPSPVTPTPPAPSGIIGNMRVLVLYESTNPATRDQLAALNSTKIRAYLSAHCLKNVAGMPEWRFWDKDVVTTNESPEWQSTMTAALAEPTPIPKVVVFAGNTVAAVQGIKNEADMLAFLTSKGGN